jgi:hypothetical protein
MTKAKIIEHQELSMEQWDMDTKDRYKRPDTCQRLWEGENVNLALYPNHIRFELNPEGYEFITEHDDYYVENDEAIRPDIRDVIFELAEDIFCNSGWETIAPENIGALTGGLLIAEWADTDNDGNIVEVGDVFWDANYMVKNLTDDLLKFGFCNLRKA